MATAVLVVQLLAGLGSCAVSLARFGLFPRPAGRAGGRLLPSSGHAAAPRSPSPGEGAPFSVSRCAARAATPASFAARERAVRGRLLAHLRSGLWMW
jgi:hypothetical protein